MDDGWPWILAGSIIISVNRTINAFIVWTLYLEQVIWYKLQQKMSGIIKPGRQKINYKFLHIIRRSLAAARDDISYILYLGEGKGGDLQYCNYAFMK
jgi:hypothetical protein